MNSNSIEEKRKLFRRSEKWGKYKNSVRARCEGICEYCRCRDMESVHHRINDRVGPDLFSDYENPILEDLMGVCKACHNFIHTKTGSVTSHPKSLAKSGDSGFTKHDEQPGHWFNPQG